MRARSAAVLAVMCLLLGAPPVVHADFVLRATYLEQHGWPSQDANVDTESDVWVLTLLSGSGGCSLSVDAVRITLPSVPDPIYFDVQSGGAGFNAPGPFTEVAATGLALSSVTSPADGGQVLAMDFTGFDQVGDCNQYTIDCDNSNARVPGYHELDYEALGGSALFSDPDRQALLEVSYMVGGVSLTAAARFVDDPSDPYPHNRAYCDVVLTCPPCEPIPEPFTIALLGTVLCGAVAATRRKGKT